jgi:hypothetical protein
VLRDVEGVRENAGGEVGGEKLFGVEEGGGEGGEKEGGCATGLCREVQGGEVI